MAAIASTLSIWGTKKRGIKAKGSSVSEADAKAMQQRRDANKRSKRLGGAPHHVKDTWEAIQALSSRNRQKKLQTLKFTEVILRDVNFEDVYWQSEVTDSYSQKMGSEDIWILRAKADTQHGEKGGHEAVQAAIDAGIYKSRMIKVKNKEGKLVQVEQVNISDENNLGPGA